MCPSAMIRGVRPISNEEALKFARLGRHPTDACDLHRGIVIPQSAQGFTPLYIAEMIGLPQATERAVLSAQGWSALAGPRTEGVCELATGPTGVHHQGQPERALAAGDRSMGSGEPSRSRGFGDAGEWDEPGGVPRRGPSELRDGGEQVPELGRGPPRGRSGDRNRDRRVRRAKAVTGSWVIHRRPFSKRHSPGRRTSTPRRPPWPRTG